MTNGRMKDGIVKRGTSWSYVVRETDPETGKRKPRWVSGFPTSAAAKRARDEARAAMHRGTYVAPQDLTVGQYLERWITAHEVELKPSTAASYRSTIKRYLTPAIGHERVQSLSPSRLSAVFQQLREEGGRGAKHGRGGAPLSGRTVEFARAILRRAMRDAVMDRVIEVNPVVGTKRPRPEKPKHVTWTAEQLRLFLASVEDDRLHPLWELATATGMRRGELLGLRWDDVDLEEAVISVERSTTQVKAERVTTTPKNHERRRVAIGSHTVATLRAWKKAHAAERLAAGPAWVDDDGHVFTWQDGKPLLPDYVSKRFQAVQKLEGLPRMTLHGTRHTHATILLREGVPVHIVSKRLGHKDVTVTLNIYADVLPEDDDRAKDVYEKAVWSS